MAFTPRHGQYPPLQYAQQSSPPTQTRQTPPSPHFIAPPQAYQHGKSTVYPDFIISTYPAYAQAYGKQQQQQQQQQQYMNAFPSDFSAQFANGSSQYEAKAQSMGPTGMPVDSTATNNQPFYPYAYNQYSSSSPQIPTVMSVPPPSAASSQTMSNRSLPGAVTVAQRVDSIGGSSPVALSSPASYGRQQQVPQQRPQVPLQIPQQVPQDKPKQQKPNPKPKQPPPVAHLPIPSHPVETSERPPVDYQVLLLVLADEYFNAAHSHGMAVALSRREMDTEEYYKLVATGLGCLEAVLKVSHQVRPSMKTG